jgi:hypothetical protein
VRIDGPARRVFMGWEGVQAKLNGVELNAFYPQDFGVPYAYAPCLLAHPATLEEEPAMVRAFLAATARGYEWAAANADEVSLLGDVKLLMVVLRARWATLRDCWVTLRARWVTLRARWVTLRARWVTLRARWVTLRARWVTLRARWVTLRARWVGAESSLGDAKSSLGDVQAARVLVAGAKELNGFELDEPMVRLPASHCFSLSVSLTVAGCAANDVLREMLGSAGVVTCPAGCAEGCQQLPQRSSPFSLSLSLALSLTC